MSMRRSPKEVQKLRAQKYGAASSAAADTELVSREMGALKRELSLNPYGIHWALCCRSGPSSASRNKPRDTRMKSTPKYLQQRHRNG